MLSLNHLHLPALDPENQRRWYSKYLNTKKGLQAPEPEGDDVYQCFRINDPEGYEIEFFFEKSPD